MKNVFSKNQENLSDFLLNRSRTFNSIDEDYQTLNNSEISEDF